MKRDFAPVDAIRGQIEISRRFGVTRAAVSKRIAEVKRLYAKAEEVAKKVVFGVGQAVRIAYECGTLLLSIRADHPEIRGGNRKKEKSGEERTKPAHVTVLIPWEQFVEKELGFHPDTCRRYMRLAQIPREQLSQVNSIRQAYLLAGVLPAPEPKEGDREGDAGKGFNAFSHLAKVTGFLTSRLAVEPLDHWQDRQALKEQLRPLVDLYERL